MSSMLVSEPSRKAGSPTSNNKENRYYEVTQMSANWATINSIIRRPLTSDKTYSIVYECYVTKTASPILEVFKARGWTESKYGSGDQSDFKWIWNCDMGKRFDSSCFKDHMRINHFPNSIEISRKDLLAKNLEKMKARAMQHDEQEVLKWNFYPKTYVLPNDFDKFTHELACRGGSDTIWIMKPVDGWGGKGIMVFRQLKDILDQPKIMPSLNPNPNEDAKLYVVQEYLSNPYLLNGRKFDMRIYVFVKSYNPLKVYLYREGFARLAATSYCLDNLSDKYAHITNSLAQQELPGYNPHESKCFLKVLRKKLIAENGIQKVKRMFHEIDNIIIRSLQSVQDVIINDKHCFELYGYDILIDQDLKPWLIEVNTSPTTIASCQQDYDLKFRLLDDLLTLVDMENRLNQDEKRVGGFDMIWNGGPVFSENSKSKSKLNSYLGHLNDREDQLVGLFRRVFGPNFVPPSIMSKN